MANRKFGWHSGNMHANNGTFNGNMEVKGYADFIGGTSANPKGTASKTYFVDEENGADTNNGLTPATAFASILTATALARDDYSDDAEYYIYIFPGSYDESEDLRLYGHGMHLIGLGHPGADSGVNITDTNCTNSILLLAGANCTIANIQFITTSATNSTLGALYAIAADNTLITNCVFKNASGTGTYAILVDDMRKTTISRCTFGDLGTTYTNQIYGESGADKYMVNSRIEDNTMYSDNAAATGVYTHSQMISTGLVIQRNFLNFAAATGASIGIDINGSQTPIIADNYVAMASGDVPIESAATVPGILGNHTVAGTTVVDPNTVAS